MKHLMNERSHKFFCQVKGPRVTQNTTDIGFMLGSFEPTCETCGESWPAYRELKRLRAHSALNNASGVTKATQPRSSE